MISKSSFIRGLQCIKSLYLHKKRPFLRDRLSSETKAKYKRGHYVGNYSRQIFPNGIDCSPSSPRAYKKAAINTAEQIENKTDILYEAVFSNQNTLAIMDILKRKGDFYEAYEVKSSLSISETYLWDIAFQESVINYEKTICNNFNIIHLDKEYKRNGEINPQKLFKIVNVNDEIEKRKGLIEPLTIKMLEAEKLNSSPEISIGKHCLYPYKCDFFGHCWKHVPKPSVIEINELDENLKWKLLREGKSNLSSVLFHISDQKLISKINTLNSNSLIINHDSIKELLRFKNKNLIIFSFINIKPSIPLFELAAPFELTPLGIEISFIDSSNFQLTRIETKVFNVENFWNEVSQFFKSLAEISTSNQFVYYDENNFLIELITKLKTDFNIEDKSLINNFFNIKTLFENLTYYSSDFGLNINFQSIASHFNKDFSTKIFEDNYESTLHELTADFTLSIENETLREENYKKIKQLLKYQTDTYLNIFTTLNSKL